MAIELRFKCDVSKEDYITTHFVGDKIQVTSCFDFEEYDIILDISTAIKFAKTLRTEINKAKESEVSNG